MREVMYLRLVSNLSFAEIGEIIGKTENWTRVTFFRGKLYQDDIFGEIAAYQIERLKNLWYVLAAQSCIAGIVVCVIYFLLILLIRKIIRKNIS